LLRELSGLNQFPAEMKIVARADFETSRGDQPQKSTGDGPISGPADLTSIGRQIGCINCPEPEFGGLQPIHSIGDDALDDSALVSLRINHHLKGHSQHQVTDFELSLRRLEYLTRLDKIAGYAGRRIVCLPVGRKRDSNVKRANRLARSG